MTEETPKVATLADFKRAIPCTIEHFDSKQFGRVMVRKFSRSDSNRINAWLKPNGKEDKQRTELRSLRIVTMSITDEAGNLVFQFPDDSEGNKEFFEFAKEIEESEAEAWDDLIYQVMVIQGYFQPVENLLGK